MTVSLSFYTDSNLTIPVTSFAINHLVDGSDDPKDFLFYLGSTVATNKFQNLSDPGVDNLVLSITNATLLWTASTAKIVNDTVRTVSKNGFRFKVQSVSGTGLTGASEPTWPISPGLTVVDNEVTWVNDGKFHESTEVKLSSTLIGLDSAVAGADLILSPVINGGSVNAIPVYLRIDDATAFISQVSELGIAVSNVEESPI